ncbi:MAG: hypothetical protein CMJ81_22740 [Planctomycetaceae bacterium]|nr:hypothetical protein [Planctomycetaceae bacterium]MBP60270.1 hypothetical protein [Planctomycetaceae bacterium]
MAESVHPATSTLKVGQLALVTGLAVTLVMVLIYQFGPRQQLVLKPRGPASLQTITEAESDTVRQGTSVGQERAKGWPLLSLDTVLKHDPFALPPLFLPAATISERNPAREQEQIVKAVEQNKLLQLEQRAKLLQNLQQQGVEMVLINNKTRVAMVGSRTVQVGDVLDGFVITEIHNNGVVVEESAVSTD